MDSKRKTELAQRLKGDLGNPPRGSLSDAQITQCLESARFEYSKHKGKIVVTSFTTVKDQEEYEYDTDKVAAIMDILPYVAGIDLESFGIREDLILYERFFTPGDAKIYDNPSLGFIRRMKDKISRKLYPQFDTQWKDNGGTIAITPVPQESGRLIFYEYHSWMTFEQIPAKDEEIFILWAQAMGMDKMANNFLFTGPIRSVSGGGQSTTFEIPNFEMIKKQIALKKAEFNQRISISQ